MCFFFIINLCDNKPVIMFSITNVSNSLSVVTSSHFKSLFASSVANKLPLLFLFKHSIAKSQV